MFHHIGYRLNSDMKPFATNSNFLKHIRMGNKTWAKTEDGLVKIVALTSDTLNGALKVIRESCLIEENLCKAVGLLNEPGATEELMDICRDAAKDGLSVVAVDIETDNVVGVSFNKVHDRKIGYYEVRSENSKFKSTKAFFDFTIEVDNLADVFNRYKIDTALEVMFIAVASDFKRRKIANLLIMSTIDIVKQLKENRDIKTAFEEVTNAGTIPELIVAMTTSNYSHKAFEQVGSEMAVEVSYENYFFNRRRFSDYIGKEHKTCRVYCYRI